MDEEEHHGDRTTTTDQRKRRDYYARYHERGRELTRAQGRKLFNRVARANMHMSGAAFLRMYEAGESENPDQPKVTRVLMLRPFAGE